MKLKARVYCYFSKAAYSGLLFMGITTHCLIVSSSCALQVMQRLKSLDGVY